jgi:tRNA (cytidine/uridine-2'-O-)-methyltransferase
MFNIVLYEPEIPPNTGNIIRLCANTGSTLHLIHPLGFALEEKKLRRAGLDYHEWASVKEYQNIQECLDHFPGERIFALTTKAERNYSNATFQANDIFIFGPESRGLPKSFLDTLHPDQKLRIPMTANNRSLNLSNAAAVLVYEAWRQINFLNGH